MEKRVGLALGGGLLVFILYRLRSKTTFRRVFQVILLAMLVLGAVGVVLHFQSNLEFKRELSPDLRGWRLFMETMRATAPPPLAPGALAILAAIGLLAIYTPPTQQPTDGENG